MAVAAVLKETKEPDYRRRNKIKDMPAVLTKQLASFVPTRTPDGPNDIRD
jgi:hypothetical protein